MDTASTERAPAWREVALWFFAALGIRLAFVALTPQVIDSADSILYLDAAQRIADGRFTEVYPRIPLLYPALAAVVSHVSPDVETAATVVSLIAGTLLVAPVFALSRRLHSMRAARVAALTVTLWPWLVDYSCRAAPEALYVFFWFAALTCAIALVENTTAAVLALPVLLLGLLLSRPEGIVIVGAVVVTAFFLGPNKRASALRLAPALVIVLIALPLHAWLIHKLAIATGVAPRFTASSIQFSLVTRGADTIKAAAHLLLVTLPVMLGPVLGLLALIGILGEGARARNAKTEMAVGVVAAAQFAVAALSTYPEPRYVMSTIIAMALWSARGAALLSDAAHARPRWRAMRHAPTIAIAAVLLAGMWPNIVPPMLGKMSYKPLEYKIAGQWMAANVGPGLILSRKPQVGYYAKMPTSGPAPQDTLDDIHARVIDAKMRYAVIDERYSTQMVPALKSLLDPANAPPWLRVLKADLSPYPDARIVIYEIVETTP